MVMAHGQANAEVVNDGDPSLTCNHEAPIVFGQVNMQGSKGNAVADEGDKAFTLNAMHGHDMHAVCVRMREGKEGGGKGPLVSEDRSLTLATANDQVLAVRTANTSANGHGVSDGLTHTLDQANGQAVAIGMQVRRLTPVECERLQGFPDNYTRIPWRGKGPEDCPDGPRYKAMGNSWTTNVVRYLGEQIERVRHG